MEYRILGRTGLKVSQMGLGCGGPSRVGQRYGMSVEESINVINHAIDSGINVIDTSEAYGTEEIVGRAIKGYERDSLVISTKKWPSRLMSEREVRKSLERSLKLLGIQYIDIYHLHGVVLRDYDFLAQEIVPVLLNLKDEGKIRFLGITEMFNDDPKHEMFQRALRDDFWDVFMVGFNILNQSARNQVFPLTIKKNIGTLIMFAVRRAFSRPERLKQYIVELIQKKQINSSDIDINNPLGFLIHDGSAKSLVDAAYRFCRYEPGTDVILSGTGNMHHLKENIESFNRPPLPETDIIQLKRIFKKVDSVTGQ